MVTVTQSALQSPERHHVFTPHADVRTTSAGQIKTKTQAKTNLTIVTAEGDQVTLSATSASRGTLTTYDAEGRLHGAGVRAEALKLSTKTRLSIEVEGDLNAEELADIEQLLGRVNALATGFFSGDFDEALEEVLGLDELESIVNFTAKMTRKQRLSFTPLTSTQLGDPVSENIPEVQPTNAQPGLRIPADQVVDDMLHAVHDSQIASKKLGHRLSGLVSTLFANIADELDADASKRQLAAHITTTFS